jgi:hypothetical protein
VLVRCIAIALDWLSLLVPEAGERELWHRRWVRSLDDYLLWLHSRGFSAAEVRKHLGRYLRDGAAEAFSARWPLPELREGWRRRLRKPWMAAVAPMAVLAFGLWWSGGAAGLRAAYRPVAPLHGDRLVTAIPERSFFGKSQGFTSRQFQLIRTRTKSFQTLAGYATRLQAVNGQVRRVAYASPELFGMLGVGKGGAYVAEQLGATGWVGRSIETGGKTYRVTGVWPRNFRPALGRPDFWIPEAPDGFDTTMLAVLTPGVTHEAATRELRDTLLSAPPRRGSGTPTAVIPLRHGQAALLSSLWIGFLALQFGLIAFAGWRAFRWRSAWRMEAFFLAKAIPLVTGLFACSVAGLGMLSSGAAAGPFFLFWLTGIGTALGIWWARRDQHLRCPECLARMTLSVQIGTHGAALLEGVGDEVICEYGHGSLWLPGAQAQAFGPEVWRSG